MTVRITMEGITSNIIGWSCDHCGKNFIYISGAVSHWENFGRDGNCPEAPTTEDESEHG